MKSAIMDKDVRGIVASILDKIGMFIEEPSSVESVIRHETEANYASPHELAENSLKFDSYAADGGGGGGNNIEITRHKP